MMRIIIDVNLWISFCIGHHLDELPTILTHPSIELFICEELEREFADVSKRPRLKKYIRPERVEEVYTIMETFGVNYLIERVEADFIDSKDNYLLDLSKTVNATYLVTGDQNLLELNVYFETKIITFRMLMDALEKG